MTEETTRLAPPDVPEGTIQLESPPELIRQDGANGIAMTVMPVLGTVGSVALIAFGTSGSGGAVRMLFGGFILLASVGFVVVNLLRQRSQHREAVTASRREYLAYLSDLRDSVRNAASRQRRNAQWRLPEPTVLPALAEDGQRVWERTSEDADLLHTRLGVADVPLCLTLEPPQTPPLAQLDPVTASAAHRFLLTHTVQHEMPDGVDLRVLSHLEVAGDPEGARGLLRAILAHLVTFVSPTELRLAVVTDDANASEWEWVKWLPHAWSPQESDGAGPRRLVLRRLAELEDVLPLTGRRPFSLIGEPATPHLLVVVDGPGLPPGHPLAEGLQGVTVVTVPVRWGTELPPYAARLLLRGTGEDRQVEVVRPGLPSGLLVPDVIGVAEAEALARRLTRRGIPEAGQERGSQESAAGELTDLLGLPDVRELEVATAWAPRTARDRLRVPIGVAPSGAPVVLDLKESAEGGMGPHGLIIGATGSGKSEVLRTLVLALTMTHSSEELNLVLIDFKGGATFAGMSDLPHVSAVITNLSEELTLVDRMQEALQGELTRRQELLRATGPFTNVAEYERARLAGRSDLAPLPTLLIVCDEFTEMLTAKPEFAELFAAIGRLGRSLRVHLLLSSQRLDEGRLRGLESHLSYRIGLRTFSASESRQVLGVPDAHTLPPTPGVGYLRPDPATLQRFRAAYVSGPPPQRSIAAATRAEVVEVDLAPFTAAPVAAPATPVSTPVSTPTPAFVDDDRGADRRDDERADERRDERATFDIAVDLMEGRGPAAHRVWLPPLTEPATLDELASDLVVDPTLGLHSPTWRRAGDLVLPLGITDIPLEQRRETFTVSLSGAGGHLAVVGGPRSGKSTVLRTVVGALALTRTPFEAQVYVMDLGGGTFGPFRELAHVASVAVRGEEDVLRRTVAEVRSILDSRERYFAAHGIDSVETYRQRRTAGAHGPGAVDDGYGDVFLVVDGWSTLRAEYEDLASEITSLAGRGLTYGVHLLTSASRWMDFRASLKDVLGTRVELRLGETTDSVHRRKLADTVPTGRPGRGLTPEGRPMLVALPRIDGDARDATLGLGVTDLVESVSQAWRGPRAPKLRLLPSLVTLDAVRELALENPPEAGAGSVLLGIDEASLRPVGLDLDTERLTYLFGDSDSGKSSFLRLVARETMRLRPPESVQIFAVDVRRAMLGELPEAYLAGYLTSHESATAQLTDLAAYLRTRLPGADVTPAQLRERSWWTGAEVVVLVDDYDLVVTSQGSALAPLVPLLPHARDVGLTVVLTRRSGGAQRATYDPVLQAMRDLAAPGLLLSGNPQEGALIGSTKPRFAVPGRAQLVARDGAAVLQLAYDAPTTT